MSATPRPWTARGTTIWADASHPPMGHEIIANTRTARGDKHDMDNAALIVRAVNSFDAMKEALEEEADALLTWRHGLAAIVNQNKLDRKMVMAILGDIIDGIEISEEKVKAALALAKGGK